MAPFPLPIAEIFGHWEAYIFYLLIGMAFGTALEVSGFANSPTLAAQFYFKDMTVLKVMFSAIVVAMTLIFLTSALGILDYNLVWVNPTYLWPGIIGGLIMGVGFIIGGFCPGTSLVAAATFKIDGLIFAIGAFFGIFLFGETVSSFETFWHSSYMGRFTIPDMFGGNTGVVVFGLVLMAIFVFWGAEKLEALVGKRDLKAEPKWRYPAAGILASGAFVVMLIGQPTTADKWARIAEDKELALSEQLVQIEPAELLSLLYQDRLNIRMLDVRSESDYNRFHIIDAEWTPPNKLSEIIQGVQFETANTVYIVMSNDEVAATEAWKTLVAEGVQNIYILGGGINGWLDTYSTAAFKTESMLAAAEPDTLRYTFTVAMGSRSPAANPNPETFEIAFTAKVQLASKRGGTSGGCG